MDLQIVGGLLPLLNEIRAVVVGGDDRAVVGLVRSDLGGCQRGELRRQSLYRLELHQLGIHVEVNVVLECDVSNADQ